MVALLEKLPNPVAKDLNNDAAASSDIDGTEQVTGIRSVTPECR